MIAIIEIPGGRSRNPPGDEGGLGVEARDGRAVERAERGDEACRPKGGKPRARPEYDFLRPKGAKSRGQRSLSPTTKNKSLYEQLFGAKLQRDLLA